MAEIQEDVAWENLTNGIILQAVRDYEKAYMAYLRDPFNKERRDRAKCLKSFFHSEWYHMLTKIDGDLIVKKVEKFCEEEKGSYL